MLDVAYNYFPNGRIQTRQDHLTGEIVDYDYDSLHRLSSAVARGGQWAQSFSYDNFGNLWQIDGNGHMNLSISSVNNRITSATYSYDNNGNLTGKGGLAYDYDQENRLAWVSSG